MNLFVITNCGSSDIEIIGVTTVRANTCFGWKVEDFISLKSWDGKFFITHQELPDTISEDGALTKNTSQDLIVGGYKIPVGERSPVIDLSGEMVLAVDNGN